jgi:uncharacterized Tic20 family protein
MLSAMDTLQTTSGIQIPATPSLHPVRFMQVGIIAVIAALVTIIGVSVAPIVTFVLMISASVRGRRGRCSRYWVSCSA